MMATMKLLVLALATAGVATAGAVAHPPLERAIEVHKEHLGPDSTMPEQSVKGQQNALDHLVENQSRWIQEHGNATSPDEAQTAALG